MLKLSTKSSYGLRACLTLARADRKLSSSEISERDGIPRRYLEQILSALRQSGLVESTRGAKGGYSLAHPAEQISVADVVRSVEGELPPMLCTNPDLRSESCRQDGQCDCGELCSDLEASVKRVLGGTTLAGILNKNESLIPSIVGDAHDGGSPPVEFVASLATENNKR